MGKVFFHGDVVLRKISSLPEGFTEKPFDKRGLVLAEGETTGHYHAIDPKNGKLYSDGKGNQCLVAEIPTGVKHQEHKEKFLSVKTGKEVELEPGVYSVDLPNEYDHVSEEARKVQD